MCLIQLYLTVHPPRLGPEPHAQRPPATSYTSVLKLRLPPRLLRQIETPDLAVDYPRCHGPGPGHGLPAKDDHLVAVYGGRVEARRVRRGGFVVQGAADVTKGVLT